MNTQEEELMGVRNAGKMLFREIDEAMERRPLDVEAVGGARVQHPVAGGGAVHFLTAAGRVPGVPLGRAAKTMAEAAGGARDRQAYLATILEYHVRLSVKKGLIWVTINWEYEWNSTATVDILSPSISPPLLQMLELARIAACVGANGSGKSSVIGLVECFCDPFAAPSK
ncbi:hypothetical protein L7F22_045127 [Adiantum nelumboides]|nr:hypothetical protein [Adiantum nelumboides]